MRRCSSHNDNISICGNDKTHQQSSGGIAIDNLMTWDGAVLISIEESEIEPGFIVTGSNDGLVQIPFQ